MKQPCYNSETHSDCPRRHSGCAIDCPDWAAYCAERDKGYEKRADEILAKAATYDYFAKHTANNQRYAIRERQRGVWKDT